MSTTRAKQRKNDAEDLTPTQLAVVEGRLAQLERDLAALRASHEADADGDLLSAERLLPKEVFEQGAAARQAFLAAQRALRERAQEYDSARRRLDRIDRELRAGGGGFADGSFEHPDHERLREERTAADREQQAAWKKVEQAERDLEEARAELRGFVAVTTRAARVGDPEVQR